MQRIIAREKFKLNRVIIVTIVIIGKQEVVKANENSNCKREKIHNCQYNVIVT